MSLAILSCATSLFCLLDFYLIMYHEPLCQKHCIILSLLMAYTHTYIPLFTYPIMKTVGVVFLEIVPQL